jgi:hypothetical protein
MATDIVAQYQDDGKALLAEFFEKHGSDTSLFK